MPQYYVLSEGAFKAVEKTTNIVLGAIPPITKSNRKGYDQRIVMKAKAVTAILPGTFESPTTFTATIWNTDASSAADPQPSVETTRSAWTNITVVNEWNVTADADTQIKVSHNGHHWELEVADC